MRQSIRLDRHAGGVNRKQRRSLRTAPTESGVDGLTRPVPDAALNRLVPRLHGAQLPSTTASMSDIAAIKQTIARDLAPYDAMQILADVLAFTAFSAEATRDLEPAATCEYVAAVLLERQSPRPLASGGSPREESAAVQRTLDRVRGLTLHGVSVGRRAMEEAPDALRALGEHLKAVDSVQRWPGYASQVTDLIECCFDDVKVEAALRRLLGFSAKEALACDEAARSLLQDRHNAWGEHVAAMSGNFDRFLEDNGHYTTPDGRPVSQRERFRRQAGVLINYHFSDGLLEALSFSVDDLAASANVSISAAEAFCVAFHTPWGSVRGLTLLSGGNRVRRRPIVIDEKRVLVTSPGNLLWAIRPRLESALKSDETAFQTYQARRSAYVEKKAAQFLVEAFRPDDHKTNLEFFLEDGSNGEVDVLLRVGDLVLVVEAKSGELSDGATRGRGRDLRADLTALVGRSAEQATRLATEIALKSPIAFRDRASGEPVPIDFAGVTRVQSIVVTLEDLAPLLAFETLLADAGITQPGVKPPWTVSLYSLEAIARSCEFAAQVSGYLSRRREIDRRVEWLDEDDVWITHLLADLDFTRLTAPYLLLDGRTEDLDRQWLDGQRPPRMKMRSATRKFLKRMERDRPSGWLQASEERLAAERHGRQPRVVQGARPRRTEV